MRSTPRLNWVPQGSVHEFRVLEVGGGKRGAEGGEMKLNTELCKQARSSKPQHSWDVGPSCSFAGIEVLP